MTAPHGFSRGNTRALSSFWLRAIALVLALASIGLLAVSIASESCGGLCQ